MRPSILTFRRASRTLRRLAAARRGSAALEFAFVAPVFMILLMGGFDVAHMAYTKVILNGAVEQAAREGSLESADTTVADNMVETRVKQIAPNVTFNPRGDRRKSYVGFDDTNRPEKFTDLNNDGTCNPGEPFVDENRSGQWEANVGKSGNGGAGDVVVYTVTATYKPIFAIKLLNNWNVDRKLTAVAVRKNQPFAQQVGYGSSAGTCK